MIVTTISGQCSSGNDETVEKSGDEAQYVKRAPHVRSVDARQDFTQDSAWGPVSQGPVELLLEVLGGIDAKLRPRRRHTLMNFTQSAAYGPERQNPEEIRDGTHDVDEHTGS